MKRSELFFTALLLPVDWVMVVLGFVAAYFLRLKTGHVDFYWPFDQYINFVVTISMLWIPIFALAGMYSLKRIGRFWDQLSSAVVGVAGGTMLVIAWPFLTRQEFFSRLVVLYLFVLALLLVATGRWLVGRIQRFLYQRGVGVHRVLFVGTNEIAADLVKRFRTDSGFGMRVVGLLQVAETSQIAPGLEREKILGLVRDLGVLKSLDEIDEIIVADSDIPRQTLLGLVAIAEERGITFKVSPTLLDVYSSNIISTELAGLPILEYRRTPLEGWGRIWKRVFDIVVSTVLIVIFSPLMLLTAVAIKLEDWRGKIFFSELDDGSPYQRIGQFGKPFKYFKFRSMKPKTHSMRYAELADRNVRHGPLVKIPDDPRITRVGKVIRKLSLDELPELFLVFAGKMSLVGPRPHQPEEVARYLPHQRRVLLIKPGITGLAQISGRSELDFDEEVRLDTYYIENWSPWLDIKILFKTPFAVVASRKRAAS